MASRHAAITRCDAGRSCIAKHRHSTKTEAMDHLIANRTTSISRQGESELQVYRCDACDGWHIGHRIGSLNTRRQKHWIRRPSLRELAEMEDHEHELVMGT